jgi:malonyl-CoA O-methyltransferase
VGGIAAELVWPERAASRRQFERVAAGFGAAAFIHDETRRRLLERLEFCRIAPRTLVDLGSGHAAAARVLAASYPAARVLALDSSPAMVEAGRADDGGYQSVLADAQRLPLADLSAALLFANLLLPWCRPEAVFAEAARVLEPGGLALFSTLGPDSFKEIRHAWAGVDDAIHVHGCIDMHDLGDLAVASGLEEPVLDVDRIEVSYPDVGALVTDLRTAGAMNVAAGRRRGLTGRERWHQFERRLMNLGRDGRIVITLELVFVQAWGSTGPRSLRGRNGEVAVPIARLQRRS